ncbi:DUF1810 domain-containing protein [Phocoenobacter uteri]|nr:DUF1810 domain-containing protein [Phocoenobacter uteri]MDG6881802.1 hypothetical protein [Phocoenobacter uteri]
MKTAIFLEAQAHYYERALQEIQQGKKRSHWMWFIFPQCQGLGKSKMAQQFAIENVTEAKNYLQHPILGQRLIAITTELLKHRDTDPLQILGFPDNLKLQSCMTLFSAVSTDENNVFKQVLDLFYDGKMCQKTMDFLSQ